MAMSFSLVALGGVPVTINDPGCVAKTFPVSSRRSPASLNNAVGA